jgi:hypothetical protein
MLFVRSPSAGIFGIKMVFHEDAIEDFQGPYAEWKGKHN